MLRRVTRAERRVRHLFRTAASRVDGDPQPARPSLDRPKPLMPWWCQGPHPLVNEYTSVGCACPETIGGGADFQTEQECLDAGSPLDDQDIACMKRVLERANLGICSVTASNDCASAQANDFGVCEVAYSGNNGAQVLEAAEALEALHTCK